MTHKEHFLSHVAAFSLSILTVLVFAPGKQGLQMQGGDLYAGLLTARSISPITYEALDDPRAYPDTVEYRTAMRLKKRLRKTGFDSPKVEVLANALEKKQKLMNHSLVVDLVTQDGDPYKEWNVSLQRYPTWLEPSFSLATASYKVNPKRIASYLEKNPPEDLDAPIDIILQSVAYSGSALRAKTDAIAKAGYEMDYAETAKDIHEAYKEKAQRFAVSITKRGGKVRYEENGTVRELELLAEGLSNYRGSTWGRAYNVNKALNAHVNNTMVLPGETFSFNGTLDGPVSIGNGWQMAKVIYNGNELRMAPGGGICQASTTTYRAIINAGFPVVERRMHSMYVSYYKAHGVGIDATIYPGVQDLAFLNDSSSPLLIQAYTDKENSDAFVNIYGIPDGRSVELAGPYFRANAPDDLQINGRQISTNEIAWVQKVSMADGSIKENIIASRYQHLPASLPWEYIVQEDEADLVAIGN